MRRQWTRLFTESGPCWRNDIAFGATKCSYLQPKSLTGTVFGVTLFDLDNIRYQFVICVHVGADS